jgi:hypothetical protein
MTLATRLCATSEDSLPGRVEGGYARPELPLMVKARNCRDVRCPGVVLADASARCCQCRRCARYSASFSKLERRPAS